MGDMKNPGRGIPLAKGEDNDPFAELADMFEAELAMDPYPGHPSPARPASDHDRYVKAPASARSRVDAAGRTAPLAPHDQDFDTAFEAAFGDEFSGQSRASSHRAERPVAAPARHEPSDGYQSWIVPRGARPAAADPARPVQAAAATVSHGRSGYTGGRSLGADLETAIHGLSAPANPRDVIVVETQSFAPERVVDDYRHQPAQPELDEFDELIASELAVMNEPIHGKHSYPAFYQQDDAAGQAQDQGVSEFADDTYYAEEMPVAPARRSSFRRTAVTLGGGVLSLALVGAVGLFVWNGRSGDAGLQASNEPLLIKADNEPFKMVPKDPGGRTVPNQNKAVYNRVNGAEGASTTQQALLTDSEEPIDLPVEEEPAAYQDLPGVDPIGSQTAEADPSQERLDVASAEGTPTSPVPVLQPRKVRTMVVRPDGTLAPAEAEPAAAATPVVAATPAAPPPPVRVVDSSPTPAAARPKAAPAAAAVQQVADVSEPARPQGEDADPMEVAGIAPKPAPAAAIPVGGYFVQISSQPSEAAAQQSMRSLGAKFSSVISGRAVGIQPAEIPGKGTFYRVRVAAASKDEASEICGQLKSAGGNCFVAR